MKIQKYLQVGNKTLPIYQKQGKQKAKDKSKEWRIRKKQQGFVQPASYSYSRGV